MNFKEFVMKNAIKMFSIITILLLLISACDIATPSQTEGISINTVIPPIADVDVLYVNLTWHQHQPLYYKNDDGVYTRPWVRVHATKDYYDMAAIVKNYPNVHLTYNLTPVLMKQLDDFVNNGAKDYYWVLSEKAASELSIDEKKFILTRFYDANWTNIIERFPRYKELLDLRGGTDETAILAAMDKFSEQDFRDLQIWFNLAWFDPTWLEQEPLKALVGKGKNYSEADKVILFDQVRFVMAQVIPIHKELQDAGQIQVITTPYAHPILPLIYNSDEAAVGNPSAELPERFSWPNDAIAHLRKSVEMYTELFGIAPVGLWPGEGAVSQDIIPLVAKAGYQFMQTGEPVLAESLGIGSFTRDSNETVQEADDLYRPYYVTSDKGDKVAVFFRDHALSDKIGFTYSQTPGEEAASDLMQRLENIRSQLKDQNAEGPHIVSIILDGENAWEYYPNDGVEFLNSLYAKLNESETIKTVTPSEYLSLYPEQRELDHLFSGAWFSPNYDTWIGETEETQAWNYLGKVREYLSKYDVTHKREASAEAIASAQDYMYLAEGSDWFWWYGTDQESGVDEYFDTGFRALLAKVYESLGDPVPTFVNVPIIPKRPETPEVVLSGTDSPIIDGIATSDEWDSAAIYAVGADSSAPELAYTMDGKNIYIRLNFAQPLLPESRIGVYVNIPSGEENYPFSKEVEKGSEVLLGISATHLFEWDGTDITLLIASVDGWVELEKAGKARLNNLTYEMAIPLTSMGDIAAGDDIRMTVLVQPENMILPSTGPAQIILPDLGLSTLLLEAGDPAGDDKGPGTYLYPTDTVFSAQNFDIEKFTISYDASNLIFTFKFFGAVPNPWGSGSNLSLQSLDVYIDKDPGMATGNRLMLPGRNAALSTGNGWEYAIWAEGWTPGIYTPDAVSGEPKKTNTSFKIIVDPNAQLVTLRVPFEALGEGDPATWGYSAIVMSQDGFPSTGVWRVRDVQSTATQWKFGGAPEDTNHTRIIDMAWPELSVKSQEDYLSNYNSSTASIDSLTADDFAQIDLLFVK
ncbi:MAG: glycoside hydrolase [Chloroflexi bacterium HGW-Chloroflexi-5]|jgi:alpha-amylase/alpha-mannosidase (GH57 family)|nr:MAG: glycoside hydrolase [Chloroflexi bacterium HGW-Chloroflexi-5]